MHRAKRVTLLLALLIAPLLTPVRASAAEVPPTSVATELPPMTTARAGATLTPLADGRLLALGGDLPVGGQGRADVFDPSTRTWRATSPSPLEWRVGHAVVLLADGRALVVGGERLASTREAVAPVLYDPSRDSWEPVPLPGVARRDPALVALPDGRALLTGGQQLERDPSSSRRSEVFDPVSMTWRDTGRTARDHGTGAVVALPDGDVLLGGLREPERWSPTTGTWRDAQADGRAVSNALPLVRLPDGQVLAGGAARGDATAFGTDRPTRTYDPDLSRWDYAGSPLPDDISSQLFPPVPMAALADGTVVAVPLRSDGGDRRRVVVRDARDSLWHAAGEVDGVFGSAAGVVPGGVVLFRRQVGDGERSSRTLLVAVAGGDPHVVDRGRLRPVLALSADVLEQQRHLLVGQLVLDGLPLGGEPVELWRRPPESQTWSLVAQGETDPDGLVRFDQDTAVRSVWTLRHRSTSVAPLAAARDLTLLGRQPTFDVPGSLNTAAVEAGQREIRASWTPPRFQGSSPVDGYVVSVVGDDQRVERTVGPQARELVIDGLSEDARYTVDVRARNASGPGDLSLTEAVWTEPGRRLSQAGTGGTALCGRLPQGRTLVSAAGSPLRLCRAGVLVGVGSALVLDASDGPVAVLGTGPAALRLEGGTLRTTGTSPTRRVSFGSADAEQPFGGITSTVDRQQGVNEPQTANLAEKPGLLHLANVTIAGTRRGVEADGFHHTTTLRDVAVTDVTGTSMRIAAGDLVVAGARFTDIRSGPALGCGPGTRVAALAGCSMDVRDVVVDGAVGTGLSITGASPLRLDAVSVLNGRVAPGERAQPAVRVTGAVVDQRLGDSLTGVGGGGGALDVVLLDDVSIRGRLSWRGDLSAAETATGDSPREFGWVSGGLSLLPGARLDVSGTFVTTALELQGHTPVALLDASLVVGPTARLTSAADAANVPGVLCASALSRRCEPRAGDWTGVEATGDSTVLTGPGTRITYAVTAVRASSGPADTAQEVRLVDTEIAHAESGVVAVGERVGRRGSLVMSGGLVRDTSRAGLQAESFATVDVTGTTFRSTGEISAGGAGRSESFGEPRSAPPGAVSLRGLRLDATQGLRVARTDRLQLRDVTVTGTRPTGEPGPRRRAITLEEITASIGPGRDVDGLTGSSNPVDAVSLDVTLTADLTWVSPQVNAAPTDALGYVLGGPVRIAPKGTLTLPAGAVVKADVNGGFHLTEGTLDATAGQAVLTSTADDRVSPRTCEYACPSSWQGITTLSAGAGPRVLLDRARMRGGPVSVTDGQGPPDRSVVVLGDVDVDGDVRVEDAELVSITRGRVGSLTIDGDGDVTVVGTTSDRKVSVTGRSSLRATPSELVLRDLVVRSIDAPAYRLTKLRTTLGPGKRVSGLQGRGAGAFVLLDEVTLDDDLAWVTPSATGDVHPAGYVAGGLRMAPGRSVQLSRGDVVKIGGLVLDGGVLDGRDAAGAVLASTSDDSVAPATCSLLSPCSREPGSGIGQIVVGAAPAGTVMALDRLTSLVRLDLAASGPALASLGSELASVRTAGPSVGLTRSVTGGLEAAGAAVDLQDVELRRFTRVFGLTALSVQGGTLRAADLTARAIPGAAPRQPRSAVVRVVGGAEATVTCADVRDNVGGLRVDAPGSLTVSDSTLTGSSRTGSPPAYDVDNDVLTRTNAVWWGQPLGPLPDQVARRELLIDTMPAVAPPACAGAAVEKPPQPAQGVTATPVAGAVEVAWSASPDARRTGYRVTALPSGAAVDVGPSETSARVSVPVRDPQRIVVLTRTPFGDVPAPASAAVVVPVARPEISSLSVPAEVGPAGIAAVTASAIAQPGVRVMFDVAGVTRSVVTPESGEATVTLDLTAVPDGSLSWRVTGTDTDAMTGPPATATTIKDTAPAAVIITAPTTVAADAGGFEVSVSTEPDIVVVLSTEGGGTTGPPVTTVSGPDGTASARLFASFGQGLVRARTRDRLGNEGSATRAITQLGGCPCAELTAQPLGAVRRPAAQGALFEGRVVAGPAAEVRIQVIGDRGSRVERSVPTSENGTRWSARLDLTALRDGPAAIRVDIPNSGGGVAPNGRGDLDIAVGPPAVRGLTVTPVPGGLDLSWTPPADDANHPLTGYAVTTTPAPGSVVVTGTTARIRGLAAVRHEVTVAGRHGQVPGALTRRGADPGPGGPPPEVDPDEGAFHPLPPARAYDSRNTAEGRVVAGRDRVVPLLGSGGLPTTGVAAVVVNATVTGSTAGSDLQVYPSGRRPAQRTSNVNMRAGQTVADLVTVALGDGGAVSLSTSRGATHVILDVVGWYGDGTDSSRVGFFPLEPRRILDTRSSRQPVQSGLDRPVRVTGVGGVPVSGATAVAVNTTVVGSTRATDVQLYPAGERPATRTSSVNVPGAAAVANLAVVKVGADGQIVLSTSAGSTHVLLDVVGWYGDGGRRFHPLTPARLVDTRTTPPAVVAGQDRPVTVRGAVGVPGSAVAVVATVTFVTGAAGADLQVYPSGSRPATRTSNVNAPPRTAVPNLVMSGLGPDGRIVLSGSAGTSHAVVDVAGWFG